MRSSYDVVVIGSGFGGAVMACRLAQAGYSVSVLERGRRWSKTDFPRSPAEVAKCFWRKDESLGFLEYRAFRRIDVVQGCGVGGGSLHYFNVHLRTPAEIFSSGAWPREITRAVLDPYYSLAETMLDSAPLSPPAGRELPKRTTAFLAAASAAGRRAQLVPIGVYTGPDRANPHGGIGQSACDYSGNCMLGCALHSKNTLDLNYIPLAEKNGAEISPLHEVERIDRVDGLGYRVSYRQRDSNNPRLSEHGSVLGRKVILAGGTLGTNELLLRCKFSHRTLPTLSPMLGCRFSGNGDFLLAGAMDTDREIDPGRGPSITAGADFSTPNNRIFIEDLGFPDAFMWLMEGATPGENRLISLIKAVSTYISSTLSNGSGRIGFEADKLFRGGATTRFLPYLGMGTDAADGRFKLNRDQVEIEWSHRSSRQLLREIEQAMKELSRGVRGRYVTSILWRWPFRKLLTAHPLGGSFMGSDPETSVVSHRGEVWGYPDLFVADGSIIPSALSVNPSLTICALAERVGFWMVHGREMGPDDPCRSETH